MKTLTVKITYASYLNELLTDIEHAINSYYEKIVVKSVKEVKPQTCVGCRSFVNNHLNVFCNDCKRIDRPDNYKRVEGVNG